MNSSGSGHISSGDDQDYWRFQIPSDGQLVVETSGSTDTVGELQDSSGNQIVYDDDGGEDYNFRIVLSVSAGTYYVRVTGFDISSIGPYTLHVRHTPAAGGGTGSNGDSGGSSGGRDTGLYDASVTLSPVLGDFNGDGRDDVLLRHTDGRWLYYPMNGREFLTSGRGAAFLTSNLDWQFAGIGDLNGDGKDDVLLRRVTDGRWYYYPMDGRRHLVGQRGGANIVSDPAWQMAGIGDLNGDGKDDVLLRHRDDGRWLYYPMDGRNFLSGQRGVANIPRDQAWQLAGIGDLNGDGRDDVLLRHTDGTWQYFPMNGRDYLASQRGAAFLTSSLEWQFAGIGDLNGDGKDDVLVRRVTDGRWYYYPMDGRRNLVGQRGGASILSDPTWQLAGIGDLNGDEKDDVLLRHRDDGRWLYYPMDGRNFLSGQRGTANLTRDLGWSIVAGYTSLSSGELKVLVQQFPASGEPKYVIDGANASLQFFENSEGETEQILYESDRFNVQVRLILDENTGDVEKIIDHMTGSYIAVVENGDTRIDFLHFNSRDVFTGGFAFYEDAGRFYLADIIGTPAFEGQVAGQLNGRNQTGSYALIAETSSTLENVTAVTSDVLNLMTILDDHFSDTPQGSSGLGSRTLGSKVIPAKARKVLYIGGTIFIAGALTTALSPAYGAAGVCMLMSAAASGVIGNLIEKKFQSDNSEIQEMTDSLLEHVLGWDERSSSDFVTNVRNRFNSLRSKLADGIQQRNPRLERLKNSIVPNANADDFDLKPIFDDIPDSNDGPSKQDVDVNGTAILQDGTSYELYGSVSKDGSLNVSGETNDGSDFIEIDGSLDTQNNTVSGTFQTNSDSGSIDGQAEALGACDVSRGSGGQGTFSYVHSVGASSGTVTFFYDAYSIPDRFTVRTSSDGVLFDTGGLVSGSETTTLTVTSSTVFINISAPRSGTAWEYELGCAN